MLQMTEPLQARDRMGRTGAWYRFTVSSGYGQDTYGASSDFKIAFCCKWRKRRVGHVSDGGP